MKTLTAALRPWTIDFHVAQNDSTVKGSGTHDKTGHHCLPNDPGGKLTIAHHAGYWLHGEDGRLTKQLRHICWDGCMFPNAVMMKPETWNDILSAMIAVRDAHGWRDAEDDEEDQKATPDLSRTPKETATPKKVPKKAKKPATKEPVPAAKKKSARAAKKKPARAATKRPVRRAANRLAAKTGKPSKKTRVKKATKKRR